MSFWTPRRSLFDPPDPSREGPQKVILGGSGTKSYTIQRDLAAFQAENSKNRRFDPQIDVLDPQIDVFDPFGGGPPTPPSPPPDPKSHGNIRGFQGGVGGGLVLSPI